MKICPICETENEDGAKNCSLCGEALSIPTKGSPPPAPLEKKEEPVKAIDPASIPGPEEFGLDDWPEEGGSKTDGGSADKAPVWEPTPEETPQVASGVGKAEAHPGESAPSAMEPPSAEERPVTRAPEVEPEPPKKPEPAGDVEVPAPGTLCLVVYMNRKPAHYFPVVYDEVLMGRRDPLSNAFPDLDLTPFDPDLAISRKHAYLYREGDYHTIYPISNAGVQLNNDMVPMGARKRVSEGDVIILSGRLAMKFERS